MNMPFHFYGTFCAAITAGFNQLEATKIAASAQFVDECDEDCVKGTPYYPTYQTNAQLAKLNLDLPNAPVPERVVKVWTSFHFLPGNLDASGVVRQKPRTIDFNDIETVSFHKLMCLPYSSLAGIMIDSAKAVAINPLTNEDVKSIRIGMAMHVLADTFAHQNFVGTANPDINEVSNVNVIDPISGDAYEKKWFPAWNYSPAFSKTSIGWLGHGRIGTLPDEPNAQYFYTPQWYKQSGFFKDNPLIHLLAFQQMVDALKFIKALDGAEHFDYSKDMTKEEYDSFLNQNIYAIFRDNASADNVQTSKWQSFIQNELKDSEGKQVEIPIYNCNLKTNTAFVSEFVSCAQVHLRMVCDYCNQATNNSLSRYFL